MESKTHLITKRFAYDNGRQVTVSVPPVPAEAIVYAGDGQLLAQWGNLLQATDAPPTMIVGVHHTSDKDEMARIKEYSPSFDEAIFSAHEKFFTKDVRDWVQMEFGIRLPAEQTAVCGVSASGELALAMGMRHPDLYGSVFCMSPGGGYQPPDHLSVSLPRVYLTAGSEEPFFLENAKRWADALGKAGGDVKMTERHGGHGDPFWAEEFPGMVT